MNVIALAGLAISVGMLVDNSIVVIENIYRLMKVFLSPGLSSRGQMKYFGAILLPH